MTMNWLEYFGVITGLLYLFLEIRQHKAMWVVGFLTSLVYVFVFFSSKIYANMGLQVYYLAISVYGFFQWSQKQGDAFPGKEGDSPELISYRHLDTRLAIGTACAIIGLTAILWYVLSRQTDSPVPAVDAFTTATGAVATWMLARRIIEHWVFWVAANLVSVYLYYFQGLYPTMFLYLCYTLLAIAGYYNWKRKGVKNS